MEFDRVCFSYPFCQSGGKAGGYAVEDISFRLEEGEWLGVIGGTGSGKTTVLQLMMGYFQPSRGEIRIRGIPVRNMELARVRSAILPGGLCSIIGKFVELSYDRTKQAFRLLYNRRNTCSAVSARFWRACSGFMASSRVQMLLRIGK